MWHTFCASVSKLVQVLVNKLDTAVRGTAQHNTQHIPVCSIAQHCTAFRLLQKAELTVYLDVCRTQ